MKRNRIRWALEWVGAMVFVGLCNLLPLPWATRLGRTLGVLTARLDRRHRSIAEINIQRAFQGKKNENEVKRIVVGCFQNLGESVVEFARLPAYFKKEKNQWIEIEGLENVQNAIKKGKGILFFTAHLGNWELLAVTMASLGFPVHVVARPLDNPYLNVWVNRKRSLTGNTVINKNNSIRTILSLLRKGESVGFLLDQNTRKEDGVFVSFFNRLACTTKGLALIALRYDVPVIPVFIFRQPGGTHRLRFDKGLPLIRTGRMQEDVLQNTQQFTDVIESAIRETPAQWLWVHQRWKTQPDSLT